MSRYKYVKTTTTTKKSLSGLYGYALFSMMENSVYMFCCFFFQLEAMMPRIHMLYPLTLVRGLWEDVMNQAHSFITSTWTFYLQADDGKVVIFQVAEKVDDSF